MDWIRDLTAASVALYGFAAAEAAFVRWRRPRDVEHGIFGVLCAVLSLFAATRVAFLGGPSAALFDRVASVLACYAYGIFVHLAAVSSRRRHHRQYVPLVYALSTLLSCLVLLSHELHRSTAVGLGMIRPEGTRQALLLATGTVAAILAAFDWARAWLAKKPGAGSLCIGAVVLLLLTLHDLAVAAGLFTDAPLAQLGFIIFMPAYGGYLAASYLAVATDLESRSAELDGKSRELVQSYEDLRLTQEELFRKEQLAVVGELAAVVAHEVRNPLAVIGNAVAGLRRGTLSKEDQGTLLGILDEEASRLNRLVSDLLRFARPVNVQRGPVDLEELLSRALMIAEKTKVEITRKIELGEERVWADPSLLRQVFDNLVDNAVQAMGGEGNLSVSAGPKKIDDMSYVAVEFKDNGEGMDTLVRQRARDPFFTTRPSGTGLGLAIVDRIVEAHGGHLLIDSRPGEGTTVTVVLPEGRPSDVPRSVKKPLVANAVAPQDPSDAAKPSGPTEPTKEMKEAPRDLAR